MVQQNGENSWTLIQKVHVMLEVYGLQAQDDFSGKHINSDSHARDEMSDIVSLNEIDDLVV